MVTFTNEVITPDIAKHILDNNNNSNRNLNRRRAFLYAQDISNGKWCLNGEPIIIGSDGNLLDGQHRLLAVCISGIATMFSVARGVDPDSMKYIDTGAGRSMSDLFTMNDVPNAIRLSAMIRRYYAMKRGLLFVNNTIGKNGLKLTNSDAYDIYITNKDVFDNAMIVSRCLTNHSKLFNMSELGSIISFLIIEHGYSDEYVTRFFYQLFQYKTTDQTVCMDYLRNKIIKCSLKNIKIPSREKQNMLAECWQDYKQGGKLKRIKLVENENVSFD